MRGAEIDDKMKEVVQSQFPETEIGDRALCRVLKIDYENEFLKMNSENRLEMSQKYLEETLEELIRNTQEKFQMNPDEMMSVFVYNHKFNSEHLMNCDCYRSIVNRFMDIEAMKRAEQQGKSEYALNKNIAERMAVFYKMQDVRKSSAKKSAEFLNYSLQMKNQVSVCPYLYKELMNTLKFFRKDYDLSKTKIREVVKSIINYQISLYNSNLFTSQSGVFENVSDRFGNVTTKVSQSEYYKTRLNAEIIKAIKILDEMVEGNKNINLNVSVESVRLKDVLGQIRMEFDEKEE